MIFSFILAEGVIHELQLMNGYIEPFDLYSFDYTAFYAQGRYNDRKTVVTVLVTRIMIWEETSLFILACEISNLHILLFLIEKESSLQEKLNKVHNSEFLNNFSKLSRAHASTNGLNNV